MRKTSENPSKLSVFIGSPRLGLEEVRQNIIEAVLEAGHIPDGMELWAANAQPALKTIADKLAVCDVHLVVLGLHYGQAVSSEGISFVEWEYNQSREATPPRPVIAFLLEQEAFEAEWKVNSPTEEEMRAYRGLWDRLRSDNVCKLYRSITMPNIGRDVVNALNQIIDSPQLRPIAGWVRAESKAARLAAALQNNDFLMNILDRVVKFRRTGERFETERFAKKAAAAMFWDTMRNRLVRSGFVDLFLESGSSLAYVSEALTAKLDRQQGWRISTNNALSLLHLLLFTDGEVLRHPPVSPDPDDPYGAIFTSSCRQAYEDPPVQPRRLYKIERRAIDEVVSLLQSQGPRQIILGTASGWDTVHNNLGFRGPHVGSHPNMLFKRAIFMTGAPVVLFLSRHKVDPGFREARFKCRTDPDRQERTFKYCYPVFGEELPLAKALVKTPLALCIGYEREQSEEGRHLRGIARDLKVVLEPELGKAGFDLEYAERDVWDDGLQAGAIMVANRAFCRLFPKQ